MEKSVIIIGAGMAGLSAGCYARMNGYRARIYEMHTIPGGLCTAWKKQGYTFDISMHMLTGSVSGPFHQMWKELGVTDNFKFHFHDHISRVEGMGQKLNISVNRRKFEHDLLTISPDDRKLIRQFMRIIFGPDLMKASTLKPASIENLLDKLRRIPAIIPLLPLFMKYGKGTLQQFASKFQHPFLRKAIRFFVDSPGWPMPDFPMLALIGFIKSGVTEAGVPLGGSRQVAMYLADLFKSMGGELYCKSKVSGLIIENNRVTGIRLWDGTVHLADQVIWAADGYSLHYEILGGRYLNERIRQMYENWKPVKPIVHVMMGVNRDFSGEPHRMILEMEQPITIARRRHTWMAVNHHCFDKSMAPEGKSVVEVWIDTEYEYWEHLAQNRNTYNNEKRRIAEHIIRELEKHWPGITSQIEVLDIPTPVTYHRYTGNWKGSPDGWYLTPENLHSMDPMRTVPGLEGLYMAGQWTSPFTGTVIAALTGRQIIQLLCHQDRKKFHTTRPVEIKQKADVLIS